MVRIVTAVKILVADPFRLPDVEHAFAVLVVGLFPLRVLDTQRVWIIQPLAPGIHQSLHSFDLRLVSRIVGEVPHLVRIGGEIEKQSMVDSRIDMQLPSAVANGSLIVLKWKEHGLPDAFGLPIHDWHKVS